MPRRDLGAGAAGLDTRTEQAILDATESLLASTPLRDLTVAQILAAAGVARATFYMYFGSKQAVLRELFRRMLDEVYDVFTHTWAARDADEPRVALRAALAASYALFERHGPVARAAADHWLVDAEIGAEFRLMMTRLIEASHQQINAERAAVGPAAPAGADPRSLAAALVWMNERCFHVRSLRAEPAFADDDAMLDALSEVWARAVYGAGTCT